MAKKKLKDIYFLILLLTNLLLFLFANIND